MVGRHWRGCSSGMMGYDTGRWSLCLYHNRGWYTRFTRRCLIERKMTRTCKLCCSWCHDSSNLSLLLVVESKITFWVFFLVWRSVLLQWHSSAALKTVRNRQFYLCIIIIFRKAFWTMNGEVFLCFILLLTSYNAAMGASLKSSPTSSSRFIKSL